MSASVIRTNCCKVESKDRVVLLFARAPEEGKVKTRMEQILGSKAALELYLAFLRDINTTLSAFPFIVFYTPAEKKIFIKKLFPEAREWIAQKGEDLGQRMKQAFTEVFARGYQKCLLVGSDIPHLPENLISRAFAALENYDGVIGPAQDGGYYLIGFTGKSFLPGVFEGISWSSEKVFQQTTGRFSEQEKTLFCLSPLQDLDTMEDLMELMDSSHHQTSKAFHTIHKIKELGIFQNTKGK